MANLKPLPESTRLKIAYRNISDLAPYAGNARTHSDKQIAQIAASMRQFGFTNPVLIDDEGGIVAGHGRVAAAKQLGITEVPTIALGHLTAAERRAYVIADNRLAELAGWDREILKIEFQALAELELDFDLEITGFDTAELDLLLDDEEADDGADPADDAPAPGPAVTRPGDVWILGKHRLVCGDARAAETYAALMGEERARAVFTDPPYNVKIDGHVCGSGGVKHREFAMASGEMDAGTFTAFLEVSLGAMAAVSHDGAIHFTCMDWRHMAELQAAGTKVYSELKNLVVWAKTNGGMGTFYRSRHELIYVWKVGTAPHTNTFGLGESGRYRTNVWDYPGVNSFGANQADLALHPTVKPVALVADAIRDVTKRGEIVLDGFGGSGTTLIAAERTGRVARLVELDPIYCDVICRRYAALTGVEPALEATGATFEEVAEARAAEAAAPAQEAAE
ncbi:DNA methylase N-4 [Defluviimonas sp. 20V17]|uniref:site-specific DNA-methyltransferase (adenine-specific) n=1 Tax=Allgaiera indica TaxID=765699 RepID=A0AAN5A241_9RHOB|nr:site-specific DNA-methyltransferase [Allgaiera indica]KDB05127.1 DNA methylase N-4 [Defluviimonas sp. 20V17]GHE05228.1 methyltransferase [Allgaiera indica]SDX68404.1 DNA modification methylase [Allgaiera indica]